jgi:hypothetical protein
VDDAGPPPRFSGALAYDAERKHTVLFGGLDFTNHDLADTWAWDGKIWRQLAAFGPSARSSHKIVYDDARKCTVLFAGIGTSVPSETWEWDGSKWTQRQDMGPSNRSNHSMAYDSTRNRIVLFGGSGGGSHETWEYVQWPTP